MIRSSHRSEWLITAAVLLASVVLLGALWFALAGNPFETRSRELKVLFPDITGVRVSSPARYAGAVAGEVSAIRMLTPAERQNLADPSNAIEVTVLLNPRVPALTQGTFASLAADTILADKFILITPGPANALELPPDASIAGIAPTTIDALSANLSDALNSLRTFVGGGKSMGVFEAVPALMVEVTSTLTETRALLKHADELITEGRGVIHRGDTLVTEASGFVSDGRDLVRETRDPLRNLLVDLNQTADSLESMAKRAEKLLRDNEATLGRTVKNADKMIADLRITAAFARVLAKSLALRPQQIIWGPRSKPPTLPSEDEILAN